MQWPMFKRVEHQARRLDEMMIRLGICPIDLARIRAGDAYAQARRTCLFCREAQACGNWLAQAERDAHPVFCPNLEILEAARQRHDA